MAYIVLFQKLSNDVCAQDFDGQQTSKIAPRPSRRGRSPFSDPHGPLRTVADRSSIIDAAGKDSVHLTSDSRMTFVVFHEPK